MMRKWRVVLLRRAKITKLVACRWQSKGTQHSLDQNCHDPPLTQAFSVRSFSARYLAAASVGHAGAECNLGLCYQYGNGVPSRPREAELWYLRAAEKEHAVAQFNLAVLYRRGALGVPKDMEQAVIWYRASAEQGFAAAQCNLGVCYERGEGGLSVDLSAAHHWYLLAAEQGNSGAQNNLGYAPTVQQAFLEKSLYCASNCELVVFCMGWHD